MELSARGVLTLVDHASPARLREAYLRLRARDPATDVIVDVRRLAELPPGSTAILALEPPISEDALDWLNLNRPVVAERRLNVVLWCEDDAAASLSWRAPDFFDWISARVDGPPAPAAHAVADVRRAICARASGIAWDGPGLEETLAAVRPGRPIRRVAVASYQSMLDALTSREPGWLFLEGVDTAFHLRRLRWAMAETGRRVIVFRRAFDRTAPGWWTVHAAHVSIAGAVRVLTAAGGTGRLAALTGLDPDACGCARFALRRGNEAARLEELLAAASDPRAALQDLARQSGWTAADVLTQDDPRRELVVTQRALDREAARHKRNGDPVVAALRASSKLEHWAELGRAAEDAGDFEVEIRWLTAALRLLPDDANPLLAATLLALRGQAHHSAGKLASARVDLERAFLVARGAGDSSAISRTAASLAYLLLALGEPQHAREYLEAASGATAELGDKAEVALSLDVLARALQVQGDLAGARRHLERALSMKRKVFATDDHASIAITMGMLGSVLAAQGDVEGARIYLERSLEIGQRLGTIEHPSYAIRLRFLADLDLQCGDVSSARAHLQRALEIQVFAHGTLEHPDVADTLVTAARACTASGDLIAAQVYLEQALAAQQEVLGDDGQLSGATTRRALAGVLVARGDLAGAIEHLERALVTLRKIHERDDHPEIAATLRELERLQRMQRDLQRAD
jgi:tetratricopeptide (TPR) repeat protein